MTATIIDAGTPGLHWSGDTATYNDRVENGPDMAAHLGRSHSAPSRVYQGILWGDPGDWRAGDTTGGDHRRMLAIGIVEEREGGIWTGRTPSGTLDGATVTPI